MASARKKTWTKTLPTGKKVRYRSTKYYAFYRDGAGGQGRKAGYTDKKATLELARRLEVEAARKAEGLIDVSREHRKKPIGEHIEQYRLSLQGRVSAKHLAETMRRARGTHASRSRVGQRCDIEGGQPGLQQVRQGADRLDVQ